jgi:uncharacterized protein (TIGR02246 family)
MKHLFIAATLFAATTFSINSNAQKISEADNAGITKTYQNIMAAFAKMDASAVANSYTENGTHIGPNGQIITGRAALKESFEKLFAWFKTLPAPDKTDYNQTGWNTRYLSNDFIQVSYSDEQTAHYGNKTEKTVFAMSVILKRTKDGWLCELVQMTPVKPMQ